MEQAPDITAATMQKYDEYNALFQKYFPSSQSLSYKLKQEQFDIIYHLVDLREDVIGILPTGFGKSICFQLPLLITQQSVLVISPLLSLMKDQTQNLTNKNIPVMILNSATAIEFSMFSAHPPTLLQPAVSPLSPKIIYVTPEYFLKCEEAFIKQLNLALICFDEVHTVSAWGKSFRPAYAEAASIIRTQWTSLADIPILACTATANAITEKDIIQMLKLKNPLHIVKISIYRANLYLEVQRKSKNTILPTIITLLKQNINEYIVIYCQTRENTEKLAEEINNAKIYQHTVYAYHAGLDLSFRNEIQEEYQSGLYAKCIVATVAFGMGINIPNIRLVIHYNCPKSLDQYVQEIGRAGRDHKPSRCIMYYEPKDFSINKFLIKKSYSNEEDQHYYLWQCNEVEKYISSPDCRKTLLLKNFGEKQVTEDKQQENCCDNCDAENNAFPQSSQAAAFQQLSIDDHKTLSIINKFNRYGYTILIGIIRGSNAKTITSSMKDHQYYGFGKQNNIDWWKNNLLKLVNEKYIKEQSVDTGFGMYLTITPKGIQYLVAADKEEEARY